MSDLLFDRSVALSFGRPGELRSYTDLRVTFEVELDSTDEPNKGRIQVWNLNENSRSLAEQPGVIVTLAAGYGNTLGQIFSGDVQRVLTRKDNQDFVTEFEAGDGEAAYQGMTVNASFSPGTTFRSVIDLVTKSFGLPVKQMDGIPAGSHIGGVVVAGKSSDELTKLLDRHNLVWSIQNGAIQILPRGSKTREAVVFLSAETGLIGSPRKKDKGIEVTCLMNPQIAPDRVVIVESINFTRQVIPRKVRHKGDNMGGDFFTTFECDFSPEVSGG